MSLDTTLQRIAAIDQTLANPTAVATLAGGALAPADSTGSAASASPPSFASALAQAGAAAPGSSLSAASVGGLPTTSGDPAGRIVAAAETQIGQTEQPPGSNESPAIAEYRSATVGALPGAPWCAYFASWAARQAGEPLGTNGEGLGSVSGIWSWAQNTGRAIANGPGVVPKPGDLIVFGDEHVGIVRGVLPNGNIQTIEGNYENKVSLNERPPGEASGYVEMS
jgi:hypothetical protein